MNDHRVVSADLDGGRSWGPVALPSYVMTTPFGRRVVIGPQFLSWDTSRWRLGMWDSPSFAHRVTDPGSR